MNLLLEIVSEHRDLVGDDAVHEFREEGGTIGRSLQNDWILPDPDRFISGRHATIDYKGGIYYLLDTSSNGVYVNGDCEPLGKGNARRLFNGDQLRLGDFEIVVSIDSGESLVTPLDDTDVNPVAHDSSLVDDDPLRTGIALLDEDELTGDDEFQSALFGGPVDTGVAAKALEKAREPEPPAAPPAATAASADADLATKTLVDAFMRGLGSRREELPASADLAEVMHNAGAVLREFVDGSSRMLASRANLKSAFRLDQTTVLPRHNNPLKLSTNTGEAIRELLVGKEGEYLGPRDAVREVCRDLLFHQDAFLDAMSAAFDDFADRFDPDELEQDFDRSIGRNPLARLFARSKYWPLYRDLYPVLTEKGSSRFPQMYSEEFVKAYEKRIAEFKRLGGVEDLKSTVVLEKSDLAAGRMPQSANDDGADAGYDEGPDDVAGDDGRPPPATAEPEISGQHFAELRLDDLDGLDGLDGLDDLEDLVNDDPAGQAKA